jgi:hypothetical protein
MCLVFPVTRRADSDLGIETLVLSPSLIRYPCFAFVLALVYPIKRRRSAQVGDKSEQVVVAVRLGTPQRLGIQANQSTYQTSLHKLLLNLSSQSDFCSHSLQLQTNDPKVTEINKLTSAMLLGRCTF